MQRLKIDVMKLDKTAFFKGKTGAVYADLTLMDNRDGTDQYGYDGFVVQDIGKERREAGEKGPIVGNWKHVGQKPAPAPRQTTQGGAKPPLAAMDDSLDDDPSIPF